MSTESSTKLALPRLVSTKSFTKTGQIWSIDFFVAIIIFVLGIVFFLQFGLVDSYSQHNLDSLAAQNQLVAQGLIEAGIPLDWTEENVLAAGLTDGEFRLQPQKVAAFASIAQTDYDQARRLLSTTAQFQVIFRDVNGSSINIGSVGSIGATPNNPDNLLTLTRYVFYNSSIVEMVVRVW